MIKTERTNSYRFTAPLYKGEITNPVDIEFYALCLQEARDKNESETNPRIRYSVRKRFRGTRRTGYRGQSMCLKQDATRCDIYIYGEFVRRG